MLNAQWQYDVGPQLLVRQYFCDFALVCHLQFSALVFWLSVRRKKDFSPKVTMALHNLLPVAMLDKMAFLMVPSHSPILIHLIIIVLKIGQVHQININQLLACIWKLRHRHIRKLRVSDIFVHHWSHCEFIFLDVVWTWLKIDTLSFYLSVEIYFVDLEWIWLLGRMIVSFFVLLVSHFYNEYLRLFDKFLIKEFWFNMIKKDRQNYVERNLISLMLIKSNPIKITAKINQFTDISTTFLPTIATM